MANPEKLARQEIDRLLAAAGRAAQDFKSADIHAVRTDPGDGRRHCPTVRRMGSPGAGASHAWSLI